MVRKLIAVVVAASLFSAVGVGLANQNKAGKKHDRKRRAKSTEMIGKTAPEFELKDLDGNSVTLKAQSGKIVILEWANKDCPVWEGKMEELASTFKSFKKDKDIVWFAIDSTNNMDPAAVKAFLKEKDIDRTFLDDRDGKVGHAYDARTTPHMFIIGTDGKLAYDGALDNRKEGKEHVNYVTKAVNELKAGKAVSEPMTDPYGCSVKYKKSKGN